MKYNNRKTVVDGIKFDSKGEARRYSELKLLQRAGEISDLKLQPRFELLPKQKDERAINYTADFMYQEGTETVVEDFKGKATRDYIMRRKMFKYRYPEYKFREVK